MQHSTTDQSGHTASCAPTPPATAPRTPHRLAAYQLLLTLAVIALVVAGAAATVLLETAGGRFP